MGYDQSEDVSAVRSLFEAFEKAETLEEKTEHFDAAMLAAKDVLECGENEKDLKVVTNLMRAYTRKLLEFITTTGEKTTDDLLRLLLSSLSASSCHESILQEDHALAERYDEFMALVREDRRIIDAFARAFPKKREGASQ